MLTMSALVAAAAAATIVDPPPAEPVATVEARSEAPPVEAKANVGETGEKPEKVEIERGRDRQKNDGKVAIHGRVFLRSEVESQGDRAPSSDVSLASVRAELRYRWQKWLRVIVEAELTNKPDLRDGFINARNKMWSVRAGQFKLPVSVIEMESPWTLPVARRGLLNDVIVDTMQIAGRRPGAEVEWRGRGVLDLRLTAGAFQGVDASGDRLSGSLDSQSVAGRASVSPGPIEVGVSGEWRAAEPLVGAGLRRFWSAGLDTVLDVDFGRHGLRVWGEVLGGGSWIDEDPADGRDTTFAATRAIAAWRLGGGNDGDKYIEPYVMVGVLDPNLRVGADLMREVAAGVNLGVWRRVRLTFEYEAWRVERNTPPLLLASLQDRDAFVFQVGGAF